MAGVDMLLDIAPVWVTECTLPTLKIDMTSGADHFQYVAIIVNSYFGILLGHRHRLDTPAGFDHGRQSFQRVAGHSRGGLGERSPASFGLIQCLYLCGVDISLVYHLYMLFDFLFESGTILAVRTGKYALNVAVLLHLMEQEHPGLSCTESTLRAVVTPVFSLAGDGAGGDS